jgi:hypothetical protein
MASPAAVLSILVNANTAQATAALAKTQGQLAATDRAAGKTSKTVGRFGPIAKAGGIAFAAGIGVAVVAVKGFVHAAAESQVSQTKLQTQLKASGISYRAHAKEIDAVIQKTSKLAGLDDEDLQDAFTNIVRTTGNVKTALKDVGIAADIARAKHVSLETASKALARAEMGSTTALKRYGISVDEVTTRTDMAKAAFDRYKATHKDVSQAVKDHFADLIRGAKAQDKAAMATDALTETQKRFGGAAEAYGKTAVGAQERFQVAVENLQESLGKSLLPVITQVANALANAAGWLEENRGAATVLAGAVGALAAALVVAKTAQLLMNLAVLANPYVAATVAIVAFGVAIYVFRDKIMSVFNWLKDHWPEIATIISGPFVPLVALATNGFGIRDKFIGALTSMKNTAGDVIGDIVGLFAGMPGKILGLVKEATEAIGKFTRPIIDAFHDVKDIIAKVWTWISKVIDGVKDAAGLIGKIKIPHIDLNPFGGRGGGNVGPGSDSPPSSVDGFTSTAAKFGLMMTSGYRPGDPGYHGLNRARDYSNGTSTAQELAFAKYMVATYGSKLKELIHTPLGYGIKNGQKVPLGFWGDAVNAAHYNHVHVALASGGKVKQGGWAVVGERGPELAHLPGGSTVYDAQQTRGALGSGPTINIAAINNYSGEMDESRLANLIAWKIETAAL